MAEKVYYRGEGDENTFHDTTARQLREAENSASRDFSETNSEEDSEQNLETRRKSEDSPNAVNANLRGKKTEEDAPSGFWRGRGQNEKKSSKKKKGIKRLRGFAPALLILMGIFGVGGLSFMGTMMGPFALVSNALDQFNVMRTSMNTRSTYFMRFQMDETLNTSLTNRRFGIFSKEKFKISNKMANKLQAQGIEYEVDSETNVRYLKYTNPTTGVTSNVVANDSDYSKLSGTKSGVIMLDDILENDTEFFTAHQNATKTVKGHIVGWFESLTESFHNRIKNTRNKFFGADDDDEEESKRKAKSGVLSEDVGDSTSEGQKKVYYYEYEEEYTDTDGSTKTRTITVDLPEDFDPETGSIPGNATLKSKLVNIGGTDALVDGLSEAEVSSRLTTRAEKASAALGKLSGAQGIVCGFVGAANALNLAITAIQVAKTLNFTTGVLNAIQETQSGDGGSAMRNYFNAFAEEKDGVSTMSTTAYNRTFGGPDVNPEDEDTQKFNRDYATKYSVASAFGESGTLLNKVGEWLGSTISGASSLQVYQACLYSGLAINAISTVVDVVVLFVTGGIGNLLKSLFSGIIEAFKKIAIAAAIGVVISWLVPKVAQLLATDLIGSPGGIDSANAMRSGFNIYMGKSMESNSGAVGNESAVLAMYRKNQEIIANDARYARATKSPFDPTSKYTFVGSLLYSLMPMANMVAGNSTLGAVGSMLTNVSKSLTSVVPGVSAASKEGLWYDITINNDCPNLSQFNLPGDAYCNPYYTTDFSTIEENPYNVVVNAGLENFEGYSATGELIEDYDYSIASNNGELAEVGGSDVIALATSETADASKVTAEDNPAIKQDSELGKYIIACTLRDAQYGLKDAAVQSWIENPTGNGTLNAIIDAGTGVIPVVGNLYDLAQQAAELNNLKWNTGQACVQDSSVNPDWEKNKWYQRYVEDQTLMEASGIIEESQVTAFVNKYYEQNPIDDSLEGVIARYSGMSKEEAENVVALAEYIDFIAKYDASGLYPLPVDDGSKEVAVRKALEGRTETFVAYTAPAYDFSSDEPITVNETLESAASKYVVYFDLRSRTYTV